MCEIKDKNSLLLVINEDGTVIGHFCYRCLANMTDIYVLKAWYDYCADLDPQHNCIKVEEAMP